MLAISQVNSEAGIIAVQGLMREYAAWAFALAPGSEDVPAWKGFDQEVATLPGVYAPPAGRLLLAMQDGQPAGIVCLKAHDATTSELKRLYVSPTFRGQKIGQQLVNLLVEEARQASYQRIVLDSHCSMTKAHAIYQEAGFRLVSAPDGFPEEMKPFVVFMECDLSADRAQKALSFAN
jgi:ribosomal protein S18 acetylase RimI-like enzyme